MIKVTMLNSIFKVYFQEQSDFLIPDSSSSVFVEEGVSLGPMRDPSKWEPLWSEVLRTKKQLSTLSLTIH